MASLFRKRTFSPAAKALLWSAFLLYSGTMTAQRHGGGFGGGVPGANNRPTGVDEKDSLKDFHHALAVQATSQQIAEFQALIKETNAAKTRLQTFMQQQRKAGGGSEPAVTVAELDESLQHPRADSQKFVEGFSAAQKSGLKELLKKLGKAESDLEAEQKKLDESLQAENKPNAEIDSRSDSLTKSLTEFSSQQLALGREMGVVLAQGSDLTFKLADVRSPVSIGNQTIAVAVSGELSQVASQGTQRTFKLQMVADLSDLQQKITELLRAQLDGGRTCGERLAVRQATIVSSTPASVLVLQLHYERWSCVREAGESTSRELAEGDGSVEMKFTPVVERGSSLGLKTEFSRIDATGMMGESLRSGDLGDELRDKLSQAILSAVQAGTNFQKCLPPAVRDFAVAQSARFQDAGVGRLGIAVDGQLEASDEQVNLMASQLNQAMLAQQTASQQEEGLASVPAR
jgi:hypothetical protein